MTEAEARKVPLLKEDIERLSAQLKSVQSNAHQQAMDNFIADVTQAVCRTMAHLQWKMLVKTERSMQRIITKLEDSIDSLKDEVLAQISGMGPRSPAGGAGGVVP